MERYADALLDAVRDTEYAAVQVRRAAVQALQPVCGNVDEYLQADAVAAVDITEQGYLNITLPVMMPQRKEGDRARFLSGPIRSAVTAYFQERPLPRFEVCVLVYEHIYDRNSRRRFVDHDNLELKHCQDLLENYFLANDSSALCSAFQCSHRGDRTATRIWILRPEQFREWLEGHPECWLGAP